MPVYVPVIEKLPEDLALRNKRAQAKKSLFLQGNNAPFSCEIEMSDEFQDNSEHINDEL